jgi:hypothetical protein
MCTIDSTAASAGRLPPARSGALFGGWGVKMSALEENGRKPDSLPDEWEVCFFSDAADYQFSLKCFGSRRKARRFMAKTLKKSGSFYCATVSNERRSAFQAYYWNGRRLIDWNKSWVLPRRKVVGLELGDDGQAAPNAAG